MSLCRTALAQASPKSQLVTAVRHSSGAQDFGTQIGFKNHRDKFFQSAQHASKSTPFWMYASIAVAPIVAFTTFMVYMKHEQEHAQARPEFIEYPYMYFRSKAFPWGGNKSFFHSPEYNPVPGKGYEVEDPAAHH
jgi:hypothetical protein